MHDQEKLTLRSEGGGETAAAPEVAPVGSMLFVGDKHGIGLQGTSAQVSQEA